MLTILGSGPAQPSADVVAAISGAEVKAHVAHLLGTCGHGEWSCSFCEAQQRQD